MNYKAIIGLEVHCELKTNRKMFCSCQNDTSLEAKPNTHICPRCTGQPGTLPMPNKKALEGVIKAGLALNCDIAKLSKFDRKNYFYPDLPKGYQISQYDIPLCEGGLLEFGDYETGDIKKIRITRIHMEEDTGKIIHDDKSHSSLIDFNRAGVPLMELVTEADLRNAQDARNFCQELQKIIRYLDISDADMEKGQMRCEANISIMPEDQEEIFENFGTKVEIKNLNSFKAVERAIAYEIERQTNVLNKGEKVIQETRGWNEKQQATFSQRSKEGAAEYRYFPEPDIPPIIINHEDHVKEDEAKQDQIYLINLKGHLGELPLAKTKRFMEEYALDWKTALIITNDKDLANYTEKIFSELQEWFSSIYKTEKSWEDEKPVLTKMTTGWLTSKLFKLMSDHNVKVSKLKITPENFAELITILYANQITSSAGQVVLETMFINGNDPTDVIDEKNLLQISDTNQLDEIVDKIITDNPTQVKSYKEGKTALLKFFLGQAMKETKGKANPQVITELLGKKLNE